ncbi:MAG: hypothetical protein ACYS5V_14505, partial [Planctomycetota bacterium]
VWIYDRYSAFRYLYLSATRFDEWIPEGMRVWTEDARQFGCARIELVGRPGWQKLLKPHGFGLSSVMLDRSTSPAGAPAAEM